MTQKSVQDGTPQGAARAQHALGTRVASFNAVTGATYNE